MPLTMSTLYYAAAVINLITIPKHFLVGQGLISKSIAAIPASPELAKGKLIIKPTWDFAIGTLFLIATLNYKWGKSGGPQSFEDRVALWTITVTGSVVGFKYYKAQMYVGLGCLWVAPWMSSVALLSSGYM